MKNNEWFYVWPVQGGEPLQGTFAFTQGRNTPTRALLVRKDRTGYWEVQVDGEAIAPRSQHWAEAFGELWEKGNGVLLGRKVDLKEYERIIFLRNTDAQNGVSALEPIDHNKTRLHF